MTKKERQTITDEISRLEILRYKASIASADVAERLKEHPEHTTKHTHYVDGMHTTEFNKYCESLVFLRSLLK